MSDLEIKSDIFIEIKIGYIKICNLNPTEILCWY